MDLLSAMRFYIRVYEAGSFSVAAKQLETGQPSVSKSVAQLEDHLGTKLLLRSTRGLAPTDAGHRFYEHALRAVEDADLAVRAAKGDEQRLTGKLRVSGTITFVSQHVIPKLPLFFADHPDIEIDFLLDDGDVGLIEEGAEVALRMGNLAASALTARKIGRCRRIVVATPDYFTRHGQPNAPEDLPAHPTLVFSRREGGEQLTFTAGTETRAITLAPRLRVSALEGLRAAVLAGLGIAVATEWIFTAELDEGRVKEALSDWQMPPLELWAVTPGGRRVSPKARAFITFVEQQLQQTRFGLRNT